MNDTYFNRIIDFSKVLEDKRELFKKSDSKAWSYRGFSKYSGINHRHISRVLNPKESYTFLTLVEVSYFLKCDIIILDSTNSFRKNYSLSFDLDTYNKTLLKDISIFLKEKKQNLKVPKSLREIAREIEVSPSQIIGVLKGSKNYNIVTLFKLLDYFDSKLTIK